MSSVRWLLHVRSSECPSREGHAVAVEAARPAERRAPERSHVVARGEGDGTQPCAGRLAGVADAVLPLHRLGAALERGVDRAEELRSDDGVGIDDNDGVDAIGRCCWTEQPVDRRRQRRALAAHVSVELVDGRPGGSRQLGGAVGAVVGDHVDLVVGRRVVHRSQGVERLGDHLLLVVGGNEDGEAAGARRRRLRARPASVANHAAPVSTARYPTGTASSDRMAPIANDAEASPRPPKPFCTPTSSSVERRDRCESTGASDRRGSRRSASTPTPSRDSPHPLVEVG